jgi:hypothetical protein
LDQLGSVDTINALAACFKGLAASEDDIFDADEDTVINEARVRVVRADPRLVAIRLRAERAIMAVWSGDSEIADVSCVVNEADRPSPHL